MVQAHPTSSNLPEPQHYRDSNVCRVLSHRSSLLSMIAYYISLYYTSHNVYIYINTLNGGYIRLSYIVLDSHSVFRAFCAADFLASFTVLCGFPRKLPQLTITRCWCGRSFLPLATHSYLGSRCLCCSQYSFSCEIASLPRLVVGNGTEALLFFD